MAARKTKKQSIDERISCLMPVYGNHVVTLDSGVEYIIKPYISVYDKALFVANVVDMCFLDGETYTPFMKDFAFKVSVIKWYTDLNIDNLNSLDADKLVSNETFYNYVCSYIKDDLVLLENYVDAMVDFRINLMMKSTKADELYDTLISMCNTISEVANEVKEKMSNINPNELTSMEIKDIMLGAKLTKDNVADVAKQVIKIKNDVEKETVTSPAKKATRQKGKVIKVEDINKEKE